MRSDAPVESSVESHLRSRVKALGGDCLKFVSPGNAGVSDRLVLLPHGVSAFVELKRLGEAPAPLQERFIRRCHALGHLAFVASTVAGVDALVTALEREMQERQRG